MTITAGPNRALTNQTLRLCAEYVTQYGNDLDQSDYYRLQAAIWDATGAKPDEGHLDEALGFIWTETQVDAGNIFPEGWPVGHPEHGPAVSTWKARNADDIEAALAACLWRKEW